MTLYQVWIILMDFNPIPTEGGPFGPKQPKTVWHFHSLMAGVTKIHDFVYFSTCLVLVKLFLKKKIMKSWKIEKNIFTVLTPKGPPFGKKLKKIKLFVSFPKNHTISTWIWILHVLSFLLRYMMSILLNFFKFSLFLAMKFPSITTFILRPLAAKIVIIGDYFGHL